METGEEILESSAGLIPDDPDEDDSRLEIGRMRRMVSWWRSAGIPLFSEAYAERNVDDLVLEDVGDESY